MGSAKRSTPPSTAHRRGLMRSRPWRPSGGSLRLGHKQRHKHQVHGCGSKLGTQIGTLANGAKDQSPGGLIQAHVPGLKPDMLPEHAQRVQRG